MQSSTRQRVPCIAVLLFVVAIVFYSTSPSFKTSTRLGSPVIQNVSQKPSSIVYSNTDRRPSRLMNQPAKATPISQEPIVPAVPSTTSTVDTQKSKTPSSDKFVIGKKVAVIIEDRPMTNLIPLIMHFSSILGPDWPIMLFTSMKNITHSAPFQRAIKENNFQVHTLPKDLKFIDHQSVSDFLVRAWLWEQLAPAEHVLLFQADSIICANAPQTVDDFLQYDFVGAPIDAQYGKGYNGGLSLRNRQITLDIIKANLPKDGSLDIPDVGFEDQWFYKQMVALPPKADGTPGANLPSVDVAKTFAVETIYYDRPLGYHQVARWQKGHEEEIGKWCPEYNLCTGDLIITHG